MIVKPLETEWNRSGKKARRSADPAGKPRKNFFRRIYTMRKSIAITLILTIVLSICAVMPAALAEAYYIRTDNGKTVNLREEPNTTSRTLLRIPYGDPFYVSEFLGNGWAYGHWGGQFGYVMSRFLSATEPEPYIGGSAGSNYNPAAENRPSSSSSQTNTSAADKAQLERELSSQRDVTPFPIEVRASRATGRVNFRVGPSASTARITLYPDGKELMCTGETTNWYRAYDPDNGNYGYIHKNYATKVMVAPTFSFTSKQTPDKKTLGTLNVNGKFDLVCQMPEGYDLQVVNMRGSQIIASILPKDMVRPQMYLTIAFDESYADVKRMNDLTPEELKILENTFQEMNRVEISYRETGYGTKLLVAKEIGNDTDFVDILAIYQGYFIEFTMSPNENNANKTLNDQQIKTCIDFLTNLDFTPVA